MPRARGRDIVEIFGHAPDDITDAARGFWARNECPFTLGQCIKWNHDRSVCYGTCSVTDASRQESRLPVIICPNRLYADHYATIRSASQDAFPGLPFLMYAEYRELKISGDLPPDYAVAFGKGSGKEIQYRVGESALNMDWIVAHFSYGKLQHFVGIEVQSIDITQNYRDTWAAYASLPHNPGISIPPSSHGLNWANVHKRLIPQIIRKGKALHVSPRCQGLYFIVPDAVYQRFEHVIGPTTHVATSGSGVLTVMTYTLGPEVPMGQMRALQPVRTVRVLLEEFADNFIAGGKLPTAEAIERRITEAGK